MFKLKTDRLRLMSLCSNNISHLCICTLYSKWTLWQGKGGRIRGRGGMQTGLSCQCTRLHLVLQAACWCSARGPVNFYLDFLVCCTYNWILHFDIYNLVEKWFWEKIKFQQITTIITSEYRIQHVSLKRNLWGNGFKQILPAERSVGWNRLVRSMSSKTGYPHVCCSLTYGFWVMLLFTVYW